MSRSAPSGAIPIFQYIRGNRVRGTDSYDRWGTFISFPEDQPAAVPIVTADNQSSVILRSGGNM